MSRRARSPHPRDARGAHPTRRRGFHILAALLATTLPQAGCDTEESGGGGAAVPVARGAERAPAERYFPLTVGGQAIEVQFAISGKEMERGLMFRRKLAENRGMIFVYATPGRRSFYMKNTSIPLDIGYFGPGGELEEVFPLYPHDENSVSSKSADIQFALEMNRGWFGRHGVRRGAKLDRAQVRAALAARGFDPADHGLE